MLPEHQTKVLEITNKISNIANKIKDTHKCALEFFKNNDTESLGTIREMLNGIPEEANTIDNEIVKVLALFDPEASELRTLVASLKITNELIRIASSAIKYAKNMKNSLENKEFEFRYLKDYIIQLHIATINALEYVILSIHKQDNEFDDLYRKVMIEESKTDDLLALIEKDVHMSKSEMYIEEHINILLSVRKLERAADHAVNIAKLVYYAKKGGKIESF
jgi:phosphate transport system protein